ncbi:MAG: tRNA lysidine(34) synthetase TilS [Clostridia bacterium]|nr:tRNA lysidine(34) synthetase TilS [Clostridia bacterium]
MNVIETVKRDIIKNRLIDYGDRVLVALSGGSDSVALLHMLYSISEELGFKICAAHVNHMIRSEAVSDEEFVKKLCKKLDIECFVKKADVLGYAKEYSMSTELAGREIRYSFFEELKEKYSINKIATAHNKNDSAESILLHLIRGCGVGGLSGIPRVRNGYIIRPILSLTKNEIENYCKENKLEYVVDKTNFETDYARNKVRLELIPLIERELNSGFIHTVTANSVLFSETEEYIEKLSESAYENVVRDCVANADLLMKNDRIISRRVIQKMYKEFSKSDEKLPHKFTDAVIDLIEGGKKSKTVNLPMKISAKYEHNKLFFEKTEKKVCEFDYLIEENRELYIKECNCSFLLRRETEKGKNTYNKIFFYIEDDSLLHIRNRRKGDSLKPVGMDGTKKLSDLFCDMKIPSEQRDKIPLLVHGNDIIWVMGKRTDRRFQEGKNLYSITVNS